MKYHLTALLAGVSMLAITSTMAAYAAAADLTPKGALPSQQLAADDTGGTEEIIVTARRKSENLQDVPATVNAVTAAQLQQLNLQNFDDIQQVVPGLTMALTDAGLLSNVNFRGIGFFPDAAGEQILGFSLNNAYVTVGMLQTAIFDIGQIEVDRGPQGTLRGEPAPAGTMVETTHAPDLERYGGYATGTVTQYGNVNINGAVNVPVIQDKLAIRTAGLVDMNNNIYGGGNGVLSINSVQKPYSHTYAGRISLRFEPNDNISANVMYEHIYNHASQFNQVFGTGSPGIAAGLPVAGYALGTAGTPANYNGGPISVYDRLSADFAPGQEADKYDILTVNLAYHFKGQLLEYIGGFSQQNSEGGFPGYVAGDPASVANPIPGDVNSLALTQNSSHELRLSSTEPDRFWDYAIGGYFRRQSGNVSSESTASYYPGAFGSPLGAAGITTFNPLFAQTNDLAYQRDPSPVNQEIAAYAHLTFHLPGSNELAFGGRYIDFKKFAFSRDLQLPSNYAATTTAAGAAITPTMCAAGGYALPGGTGTAGPGVYGSPYAGVCTASIPSKVVTTFNVANAKYHPWIYSATLSHKFNDDIMAYFNSGSSWRPGGVTIGVQNAIHDPGLLSLGTNPPEKSYNFEGGLKTTFDDKRGHFNIDYFHQIYDDYIYAGSAVTYLGTVPVGGGIFSLPLQYPGFTSHPNATVDGIELDSGYQITKELNLNLTASWAKSEISGTIPCNPPTGFPSFTAPGTFPPGTYIFFCPAHGSATTDGKFSASGEAEYRKHLTADIDGFIRGQMSFYGANPNCTTCVGKVVGSTFVIPAYQISNIFLGVRSATGAWEASIFAKNVTKTQTVLTNTNKSQISNTNTTLDPIFGNSGYYAAPEASFMLTPPREFGMTVTYSFGSR